MTIFQLNITHGACLLWLRLASLATITTGIVASLASHPNGDLIWRVLFDLLKGFDLQRATSFTPDNYATNAVLGGVMIGWGVMMFHLSFVGVFNERLRGIFIKSLVAWFISDSAGSFAAGLPGNILLNVVFILMFLPPLRALKKFTTSAGL
jgi:hypothetical protein